MRRSNWVAVLVLLAFTFMAGLWLVDVSVGAMSTDAELMNGWIVNPNPIVTYHVGLALAIISCFSAMLISVHHIVRD